MRIFVDTSYYIARMMPRDQWHRASIRAVKPGMVFFTSSSIVNETISLLQSGGYFSAALTFLERVRRNEEVQIVHPDPALQAEAWESNPPPGPTSVQKPAFAQRPARAPARA